MKNKQKKTFPFPTEANQSGELGVEHGRPYSTNQKPVGDSIDEHQEIEAANEDLAEKEISQTFNNS
ncbi:hypothetical protein [Halalkalibacterium halodurans]|jgi:hypothetical protein|uniref:Uncharacterized protein n=1 Tax=Halalkalibacterium halodurans TaxID=86665 RepID=A0A0M0KDN2_ALKHA|nr:hypothetical protein [Halalkalibacterium halodurans]MED4164760.1 hypothetical protein [Halalkalibacterium halodurans]TPE67541.1 hypothetical protein AMD02_017150 [Halalkalibacterium halodurans]